MPSALLLYVRLVSPPPLPAAAEGGGGGLPLCLRRSTNIHGPLCYQTKFLCFHSSFFTFFSPIHKLLYSICNLIFHNQHSHSLFLTPPHRKLDADTNPDAPNLHNDLLIQELLSKHGPGDHRDTRTHSFYSRVPPAMSQEPTDGRVGQNKHLKVRLMQQNVVRTQQRKTPHPVENQPGHLEFPRRFRRPGQTFVRYNAARRRIVFEISLQRRLLARRRFPENLAAFFGVVTRLTFAPWLANSLAMSIMGIMWPCASNGINTKWGLRGRLLLVAAMENGYNQIKNINVCFCSLM
nr:hypothetical protein PanWU01x14_202450 [Ipomoea trifida]